MDEQLDPQPEDPRDVLWEEAFRIYYDTYFEQLICERLLSKWSVVDLVSRLLVAVTASGSAITAWAVWTLAGFSWVWAALAGISALLSVVHSVLNVPSRLKELTESRTAYLLARADAERMRLSMRLDPQFNVTTLAEDLSRLRRTYNEADAKQGFDVFRTRGLEVEAQKEVNAIMANEVQ